MAIKVVGVSERSGNYQGFDYHNVYIHVNREDNNAFGVIAEQIKIKFAQVPNVFGKAMSAADWQALVGKDISVSYNRFGNCEAINIIKT